jgi:colanic acid/amylovoran biosynthesis glycosyltransferase
VGTDAGSREPDPPRPIRLALVVDQFPELSETFIAEEARALRELGHAVRVEARTHAASPNPGAAADVPFAVGVDDGNARKLVDVAWLAARHPLRCARDLLARRRWRREEPLRSLRSLAPSARRVTRAGETHLHAHFAVGAALDALRLGRLLGLPYSVAAHGYDIFQHPRNLTEKLERAAFVVSPSDYSVAYLRHRLDSSTGARIHKVIAGVDGERFRRTLPYSGGGTVLAIGRLIEKKGFRYLVEAAARLRSSAPLERVLIVGEGHLRPELVELAERLQVSDTVKLLGPRTPSEIRKLLERSDLLAVPCVVARDGDRDTMPVVAKEALAMEVPVVASDEVGLPELIDPQWGRLVPPRDPGALAGAIAELLALPQARRLEMGRAGRAWVLEHCSLQGEVSKLVELIARPEAANSACDRPSTP